MESGPWRWLLTSAPLSIRVLVILYAVLGVCELGDEVQEGPADWPGKVDIGTTLEQ